MASSLSAPFRLHAFVLGDDGTLLAAFRDAQGKIFPLTPKEICTGIADLAMKTAALPAPSTDSFGYNPSVANNQLASLNWQKMHLQGALMALQEEQNNAALGAQRSLRPCTAVYGQSSTRLRAALGLGATKRSS